MENTLHSGHKKKKQLENGHVMHVMHICGMSHKDLSELVWINTFVDTIVCNFRDTDIKNALKYASKILAGVDCPLVNLHERCLKGTECCFDAKSLIISNITH